ncbi:MAG: IS481 family transposase [Actinobacteria bacterium]|nr:IS481 family transposase [Actinomycetota bacterium]
MPHHRARFTARGRWDVARRVVEDGETFAQAAAWANVSRSTVWEWVDRWRRATPAERTSLACLQDRPSRPKSSPRQVPAAEAARICALRERTWSPRRLADEPEIARSHSTVHRVLQRAGVSRRPAPERPAIVRYEWPCPGNLLHMDVKRFGKFTEPGHAVTDDRTKRSRRVGWEYCHSIIDDSSRLADSEIHDDEKAATVTAFTRRALDFFLDHGVVAERLMTDNAFTYVHNRSLRELLDRRAIQHIRTRPYTPRTNGKVERYQQTLQREWAYALEYASSETRRASLPHWVRHYNERRTHSALGNRPPIQRVREVTGLDS